MNVTQKEIQDAVFLIIENLEKCTDDTLERLSFNIWAEMQDRGFEEEQWANVHHW